MGVFTQKRGSTLAGRGSTEKWTLKFNTLESFRLIKPILSDIRAT